MFLQERLVFLESFFIVALSLQTTASEILPLGSIIGERPNPDHATSGLERQAVILLVESGLGDIKLILRTVPALMGKTRGAM